MAFKTKLDYSDNRQIKQREKTSTILSGGTIFGLPFSGLTSGVDTLTTGSTENYINVTGNTFSGNGVTTIYSWSDSRMQLVDSVLSAITPSNSGITQDSGNIFVPNTTTVIDGNTVTLSYSGVSLEGITVTQMVEVTPGNYTGTTEIDTFDVLSGGSLDYTGRTIWVDCTEIARTKKLIISENPQTGYVWTCFDSEGLGYWAPSSGISADTNTFVTGATFIENTINLTRNDASVISATWTGNTNSSCISDFYVSNIHSCSPLYINPLDEGDIYIGSNSGFTFDLTNTRIGVNTNNPDYTLDILSQNNKSNLYYNDSSSSVQNLVMSGSADVLTQIVASSPISSSVGSLSIGIRGENDISFPSYGDLNDTFLYSSSRTNGLNIIKQVGFTGNEDSYIRMYAGIGASSTPHLHIQGSGSTIGNIGIGLTNPSENLDVNGNIRIRNIGSNASAGALHYDSNGVLTVNTSDVRMKTDINTITNALSKVKALRGVSYKWKQDGLSDTTRIGFIAQEVDNVVPELTFTNIRTEDKLMGVHYQDVTALLVEAVKELTESGSTTLTKNEFIINSQTVASEDNNIELNYNGTKESAIGGGIFVNRGINDTTNSEFLIDENGDWVTNNYVKAFGLIIPKYTPSSSDDLNGMTGEIVSDDNYIYVKTINGWGRCPLEKF